MTMLPESGEVVPAWDTADRMRKALRQSGVRVQEMAEYLGVTRASVGSWINGRYQPSVQTLRLWAIRCGVSYEWLRTGTVTTGPDPVGPAGLEPATYGLQVSGLADVIELRPSRRVVPFRRGDVAAAS